MPSRGWNGGNVHEINVHLPNVDFEKWDKSQFIKCRVSALHYTDYTPAMWDVEEKICTLYIDTSHNGQGSVWVKNQVAGNDFYYLKIEPVKHFPINGKLLIFLGDQTGIGHFVLYNIWRLKTLKLAVSLRLTTYKRLTLFLKIVGGCLCRQYQIIMLSTNKQKIG